jgi:hypothetical protein
MRPARQPSSLRVNKLRSGGPWSVQTGFMQRRQEAERCEYVDRMPYRKALTNTKSAIRMNAYAVRGGVNPICAGLTALLRAAWSGSFHANR